MLGGFVDLASKFRVADLAAQDGGAESKAGGRRTRLILHGWHTTKPSER